MLKHKFVLLVLFACFANFLYSCKKSPSSVGGSPIDTTIIPPVAGTNDVEFWLTKGDQSVLLQKQSTVLSFGTVSNSNAEITVDSTQTYQTIDGFGYTLTGGSASVINQLSGSDRTALLSELFGTGSTSISVSYLRISIGASDLNASVFSYDDLQKGHTDMNLDSFSLSPDQTDLIPLLKDIIAINPAIKIIATPWSAPVWMKDNDTTVGGSLLTKYYDVYAKYFVKYIQQMKTNGITIDAVTPQNEPLNPGNNPSLYMTADEQTDFIKNSLGPAFQTAGLATKIITYDHNCDHPEYATTVLSDPDANPYVNGSAFHLYAGDISALSSVHAAFPDKAVYFTEQYTASTGDFGGDLKWHLKNVIIGSMRNWSRTALEWNLANDASFNPHTVGGCSNCKGALTLNGAVIRNVGYYIVAHASKFVPAGSVRIYSNTTGSLQNVAFTTPAGKNVLVVENDGSDATTFNIKFKGRWTTTTLAAGAVGTYIWN